MRRKIWCTLVLLALPHVAAAEGPSGTTAGQALADHEKAVARSGTPVADLPPSLDLRIVPPQASSSLSAPTISRALGADRAHSADSADGPLSFGLELNRRRQHESRARQS